MYQLGLVLIVIASASSAEVPSHLEQTPYKPDIAIETHAINNVPLKPEQEYHPIYRSEEHKSTGRARIEPAQQGNIKHDMLADEPSPATEVNRIDKGYPFSGPVEVAYPDIPYAPGYGYPGNGYATNSYDVYGNSPADYYMEPDTSTFGLLWSQVPNSRTLVSYAGRTIAWIFSSIFVLLIGSALTVALCTYSSVCAISFPAAGPLREEMRSFITPERLDGISHAAHLVQTAIDKYQKIQRVEPPTRTRRAAFY